MTRLAFLEAFDTLPEPAFPPEPAGPSEDWLSGHAAGYADAMAEASARQQALSAELCQSIADLNMTAAEARAHLMAGLGPLFDAVIAQLLPAVLADGFALRIGAELASMARDDLDRPLALRVPPATAAAVAAAVAQLPSLAVTIVPDPALGPAEAVIAGPGGETAFDLDRLRTALQSALANLISEETSAHG